MQDCSAKDTSGLALLETGMGGVMVWLLHLPTINIELET